jgi:hypothetical protein
MDPISCSGAVKLLFNDAQNLWAANALILRSSTMFVCGSSQYNHGECESPFIPGGSAMQILVPWKPVVLVWGFAERDDIVWFHCIVAARRKGPLRAKSDRHPVH